MALRSSIPRLRALLGLAVVGPALALGGVWPWAIPVFAALVALMLAILRRRGRPLRVPTALWIGLLATGATLLQVLPMPGARAVLAPEYHAWIEQAQAGLQVGTWSGLSPVPADTGLEVVRLLALTGLALVCAQVSWRIIAVTVAVAGTVVAVIGLVQHGLGIERIYGFYEAHHAAPERYGALLSTFVNPNHQSGLLLLGIFATAGVTTALHRESTRLEPRLVGGIALLLQLTALVLTMSRGALLAGAVAGALALGLRLVGSPRDRAPSLPGVAIVVGIVAALGTLGAWQELSSLGEGPLDSATALRLRMTAGAPALIGLAPLTGIGRGAFGDVFPAFDPEPSHVWFSHLECAPLTMLVEWGVLLGGAILVGLTAWWIRTMRDAGRHPDAVARRIVLLGLLAVAIQSLADFSLEFLGVAAPAVALAGSLSPSRRQPAASSWLRGPVVALAVLAITSPLLLPATWAWQTTVAVHEPETTDEEVARRPLHAALHRRRARAAAEHGDWGTALVRSEVAVRLQPGHADGWLLLSAARGARGDESGRRHATTHALRLLHRPADAELVAYLVQHFPDPDDLARIAPLHDPPWEHLMRGLLEHAPRHADAIAAARSHRDPDDPRPLRHRFEANLVLGRTALALHHARLWRQLEPHEVHAHLAVTRALQHEAQPRPQEIRESLERAMVEADLADPHLRGMVEEQLLRALLRLDHPDDRSRIIELAETLRTRPADDEVRRRRLALVEPLLGG